MAGALLPAGLLAFLALGRPVIQVNLRAGPGLSECMGLSGVSRGGELDKWQSVLQGKPIATAALV